MVSTISLAPDAFGKRSGDLNQPFVTFELSGVMRSHAECIAVTGVNEFLLVNNAHRTA